MKLQLIVWAAAAAALLCSLCDAGDDDELKLSTCQQSSTFGNNTCEKAMDGNANQNFSQGSCSQVGDESTGWWQAETDRPAFISFVQIYNRQDCCAKRLTKFKISVDGSVCNTYGEEAYGRNVFNCAMRGTLLKISSSKSKLTLCEVKVFGQYLENKITFESFRDSATTRPNYDGDGKKAMDGNTGSCIGLGGSNSSWWQAGTDGDVLFEFVRIINSHNCCPQSLTQFQISVDEYSVCHEYNGSRFSDKYFRCFKSGNVLKISSNKPNMTICEVTVIGKYLDKQLKLKNCSQSNNNKTNSCDSAIDGNRRPDFILNPWIRIWATQGWWQAYTERTAFIKWVNIYSHGHCCNSEYSSNCCSVKKALRRRFEISVNGQVCSTYTEFEFTHRHFLCFKWGSLLKLFITNGSQQISEVTVFGHYLDDVHELKLWRCEQSSTYQSRRCDRAVDGITNQRLFPALRCSYAGSESTGWWKSETLKPALIENVKIYSRQDDTFIDFRISVDEKVCYTYNKTVFSVKLFRCYEQGTVLKIDSNKQYLTLCQVEVFGKYLDDMHELKLSKCNQSSTTQSLQSICDRAIDGNTNQCTLIGHIGHSCSQAGSEPTGWWKAETEKPALIEDVKIYKVQECCSDWLPDFTISVDEKMCYTHDKTNFSVKFFRCYEQGTVLKIDSKKPYMILCEVKVFGKYLDDMYELKLSRCNQSSTDYGSVCQTAIDGNIMQIMNPALLCYHAGSEPTGWWKSETEKPAMIKFVKIYNRNDCCFDSLTNFTISVDEKVCYTHNGTIFSVKSFRCYEQGTVLKIDSNKQHLTLCEVKAFGKYLD